MCILHSFQDTDDLFPSPEAKGQNNLAFASLLQLGNPAACVDLLTKTQRAPEAAMFARTYAPSKMPEAVAAWRAELQGKNRGKLATSIADPIENADLFEEGRKDAVLRETNAEKQHPSLPISCECVVSMWTEGRASTTSFFLLAISQAIVVNYRPSPNISAPMQIRSSFPDSNVSPTKTRSKQLYCV